MSNRRPLSLLLVLALLLVMLSGCAAKSGGQAGASAPAFTAGDAMAAGEYLRLSWKTAHDECARLRDALPERADWINANVAPVIDRAQDAIILVRQAAETWVRTKVQPSDWSAILAAAQAAMGDALALVANLGLEVPK